MRVICATALREDYGPGYRIYYAERGAVIIILLSGGTKTSQDADIEAAAKLLHEIEES